MNLNSSSGGAIPKSRVTPPRVLYKYYGDDASSYLFDVNGRLSFKYSLLADYNDCMELLPTANQVLPFVSSEGLEKIFKKVADECDVGRDSEKAIFLKLVRNVYDLYKCKFPSCYQEECQEARNPTMFYILSALMKRCVLCSCFSEKPDIDLMWAHYAKQHKGFCIGYKTECFPGRKFVKINYQKKRVQMQTNDKLTALVGSRESCYTKGKQWEYEKEWRCVCTSLLPFSFSDILHRLPKGIQKVNDNFLCYHDFNCVSTVFFGVNSTQEMKESIREVLLAYPDIRYYQMVPNAEFFALNHHEIK